MSGRPSDEFMARVAELRETAAVQRCVDEAPPLPQAAIDLLRAAGFPSAAARKRGAA